MTRDSKTIVVAALGSTQTLAWASSYYLPAILGAPIAAALGLSPSVFFGIFSIALLGSAAAGPAVGRIIDRHGGRGVLAVSNAVLALGLVLLARAESVAGLVVAWIPLGAGITMGLYDPAFATLTRLYGHEARNPITGITLIAGFASTVGWPVSAFMLHHYGWREACLVWAALNLFVCLPANLLLIPKAPPEVPQTGRRAEADAAEPPRAAMLVLAFFFSTAWFVTGAMAAHLPRLLQAAGASPTEAVAAAALVGPAQVAARLVEFGLLRRVHPLISARLAALMHPLGALALTASGPFGIAGFALLHGAGNGMITIAKGTLPLAIFGPHGFGLRSGVLSAPARITQSAAPFLFGLLLDNIGAGAVALSAGVMLTAFASLFALRSRQPAAAGAD
ncbi:MAG TPA: MFS transporter [Stellaceae bacterium]|nr:MFS transporter [Stellaceae bacterium]